MTKDVLYLLARPLITAWWRKQGFWWFFVFALLLIASVGYPLLYYGVLAYSSPAAPRPPLTNGPLLLGVTLWFAAATHVLHQLELSESISLKGVFLHQRFRVAVISGLPVFWLIGAVYVTGGVVQEVLLNDWVLVNQAPFVMLGALLNMQYALVALISLSCLVTLTLLAKDNRPAWWILGGFVGNFILSTALVYFWGGKISQQLQASGDFISLYDYMDVATMMWVLSVLLTGVVFHSVKHSDSKPVILKAYVGAVLTWLALGPVILVAWTLQWLPKATYMVFPIFFVNQAHRPTTLAWAVSEEGIGADMLAIILAKLLRIGLLFLFTYLIYKWLQRSEPDDACAVSVVQPT